MSGASSSFHVLDERIQRFIWAEGWESLRDAQEQAIPLLINADRDVIVAAADAVSAARPGARRESLDAYVKRLEKLEELAKGFNGVSKAYAIQAGREVRVIISPNISDEGMVHKIAYDIARKIEEEMKYPGQIKVTVTRETRATEYAK